MGKMFFNILATFAEFEADLLRLRRLHHHRPRRTVHSVPTDGLPHPPAQPAQGDRVTSSVTREVRPYPPDFSRVLRRPLTLRSRCRVTPRRSSCRAKYRTPLVELLLARDALGEVELSADLRGRLEHGHLVAAPGECGGRGESCGTSALTTATRCGVVAGQITSWVSCATLGLTRHVAVRWRNTWSAWLQAMHVLIWSARRGVVPQCGIGGTQRPQCHIGGILRCALRRRRGGRGARRPVLVATPRASRSRR
jgi:hypothetical protein